MKSRPSSEIMTLSYDANAIRRLFQTFHENDSAFQRNLVALQLPGQRACSESRGMKAPSYRAEGRSRKKSRQHIGCEEEQLRWEKLALHVRMVAFSGESGMPCLTSASLHPSTGRARCHNNCCKGLHRNVYLWPNIENLLTEKYSEDVRMKMKQRKKSNCTIGGTRRWSQRIFNIRLFLFVRIPRCRLPSLLAGG